MEYLKQKIKPQENQEKKRVANDYLELEKEKQMNELEKFLKEYDWCKYNIDFETIKYDLRIKYKKLKDVENMNMKYLSATIYLLNLLKFNTNIFKSKITQDLIKNLNEEKDKTKIIDIESEIFIYLVKITNEDL